MSEIDQLKKGQERIETALVAMANAVTDLTVALAKAEVRHEAQDKRADQFEAEQKDLSIRVNQNEKDIAGIIPTITSSRKLMIGVVLLIVAVGARIVFGPVK